MKRLKYINWLIVIAIVVITIASCKKTLTETNPSGLTASTLFTNAAGFETLVNGTYTYNRFWYGKEEGVSYSEMGTDIWTSGTGDANPQFAQYFNLQGSNVAGAASTTTWANLWNELYAAVNLCNQGIATIPGVTDYSSTTKTTRLAELRFLRAWYYWHIVETWGGVNFTTQPTTNAITTANRTPIDTFYNQIFSDLQFAVANLPTTTTDYGRVTQPIAKAFLARMYLTRGMNDQALAMATDVINNYSYSLVPVYGKLWDMGNLRNPEIIWALPYSSNLLYNDQVYYSNTALVPQRGSNNAHLLWIMLYDKANTKPLLRDVNDGRPFNRFMPTMAYINMFNRTSDSRYSGSFQDTWFANVATGTYHIGDTAVYTAPFAIPAGSLSPKYVTFDLSKVYNTTTGAVIQRNYYPTLKKFKDSTRGGGANNATNIAQVQSDRDVFLIRLAEMYLIAGEAEFKLGHPDLAAQEINVIRSRAALPGQTAQMQVQASDITMDFILDERARELGGEQIRWFDLKRTGELYTRVKALNPDAAQYIQPYDTIRPIPQSQLDAVSNKTEFKQNPGYN